MSARHLFKLIVLGAAMGVTGGSASAAPYQAIRPDIAGDAATVIEKVARRCIYDEDGRRYCRTEHHRRVRSEYRPSASPYGEPYYGAYRSYYGYGFGYGYGSGHGSHHGGHGGFGGHHSGGQHSGGHH